MKIYISKTSKIFLFCHRHVTLLPYDRFKWIANATHMRYHMPQSSVSYIIIEALYNKKGIMSPAHVITIMEILRVEHLTKEYGSGSTLVKALDDVNPHLSIH